MTLEQIAIQIRAAEETRQYIDPIRPLLSEGDLNSAYNIQKVNIDHKLSNGARLIGRKIGLTSNVVQKQLGVDQPDFGALFQDMELLNGQSVSCSLLAQPKAEVEIAFVLAEDLDFANITILDLMSSIDFALPAIEIAGSRIKDWDISILDTIADNASASHFVLGHNPRTLDEFDVVNCHMKMFNYTTLVSEGRGAACLGSPLNACLWLAKEMYEREDPLKAGDLILSGALGKFHDVKVGDQIKAEIEGLGHVSINFEE